MKKDWKVHPVNIFYKWIGIEICKRAVKIDGSGRTDIYYHCHAYKHEFCNSRKPYNLEYISKQRAAISTLDI